MTQAPDSAERRQHNRKSAGVPAELHLENMAAPMRVQTSDLSAGGFFVETMFTQPVGSKLKVVLWLGEAKVTASAVVVTNTPQYGNGISFVEMPESGREKLAEFLKGLE
jgi:c-di-GMP-binding flagellar brake protein YcgR